MEIISFFGKDNISFEWFFPKNELESPGTKVMFLNVFFFDFQFIQQQVFADAKLFSQFKRLWSGCLRTRNLGAEKPHVFWAKGEKPKKKYGNSFVG